MAISLTSIREELCPGLAAVVGRYHDPWLGHLAQLKVEGRTVLYDPWYELATPHIWVPKALPITPVELVAAAAALAIVKNPVVTRRFWQGWGK